MNLNPFAIPALVLGIVAFARAATRFAWPKASASRAGMAVIVILAGVPGALFALYYTHAFDGAGWFYEYRSLPGTELTAAGLGLAMGAVVPIFPTKATRAVASVALVALLVVTLAVPYLKSVFWPLDYAALRDRYAGPVVLQSSSSTCGPSCAATLLRANGIRASEAEIARECFTSASGTENWYLARAIRKRGLRATYIVTAQDPTTVPSPSIAGVGVGHFVTVLGKTATDYVIGDPLSGTHEIPIAETARYGFSGFFLVVSSRR